MPETITVSRVIPARAERIFSAWLDADEHAKMTGSGATSGPNGTFTAGDGYIKGRTLESTPNSRIVQSWRTTEFPEGAPDATLTVTLEDLGESGTRVTLTQTGMPDGQAEAYADGWEKFYLDPMTKYFSSAGARLKEVGAAIEEAVEKTGEAVEHAIEEAKEELGETAKQAQKAMKSAKAQAKKAVKAVKKVQKRAVAKAKAVGQKVGKFLGAKKKKPAAKKAAPKRTAARKAPAKKAAAKKLPAKKLPAKKPAKKVAAKKAKAGPRRR
jgi:uncharacterized protein YndB with AHSA1/START domain